LVCFRKFSKQSLGIGSKQQVHNNEKQKLRIPFLLRSNNNNIYLYLQKKKSKIYLRDINIAINKQ